MINFNENCSLLAGITVDRSILRKLAKSLKRSEAKKKYRQGQLSSVERLISPPKKRRPPFKKNGPNVDRRFGGFGRPPKAKLGRAIGKQAKGLSSIETLGGGAGGGGAALGRSTKGKDCSRRCRLTLDHYPWACDENVDDIVWQCCGWTCKNGNTWRRSKGGHSVIESSGIDLFSNLHFLFRTRLFG